MDIAVLDVRSLYPYGMLANVYPSGKKIYCDFKDRDQTKIGFFNCTFDQYALDKKKLILPFRAEG